MADDWRTGTPRAFETSVSGTDGAGALLPRPLHAQRAANVGGRPLLDGGKRYAEISRETGASTATITRIASWLNHGEGGYRAVLERTKAGTER